MFRNGAAGAKRLDTDNTKAPRAGGGSGRTSELFIDVVRRYVSAKCVVLAQGRRRAKRANSTGARSLPEQRYGCRDA
jgi:hypothetical protein